MKKLTFKQWMQKKYSREILKDIWQNGAINDFEHLIYR